MGSEQTCVHLQGLVGLCVFRGSSKHLVWGPWSWGGCVQHRPSLHGLAWAPAQAL